MKKVAQFSLPVFVELDLDEDTTDLASIGFVAREALRKAVERVSRPNVRYEWEDAQLEDLYDEVLDEERRK